MEIKKVDQSGLKFIANEEGLRLKPYLDSVGIPTIGIGCTYYEDGTRVKMSDPPISEERAYQLFSNLLQHYEKGVWSSTRDDINQNQFNALVSLCFNIGVGNFRSSTLLKRINTDKDDPSIKAAFEMWRNAGTRKGILLKRRQREAALYFS